MKKRLSTSIWAVLCGAVLCLGLTGCKNFIEGADVKKQLEERIAYANADPYVISVEVERGTGAVRKPAGGEASKKVSDVFDIAFEPDADFAFISWEIYDKTTGKLIPNGEYLKIARTGDDETTCQVVKLPDDPNVKLILKPVVVERPQIISATPTYDGNGAFRDSRIQVLFDRDMEIDSIYYTDAEIPEIQKTAGFNGFLPAYTFTTANGTQTRYYGYYKKTGENTEIIYKNISIIHNKNYGNLLEYFDAPRFEDPRRLIIPPKKSNLPPSGTGFQVSLNRDFFYTYEQKAKNYKKDIGMRSVHKWIFWVNEKTDTVNPSLTITGIFNSQGDVIPTTAANPAYLNSDKTIKLRVSTFDEGSGPSDFLDLQLFDKNAVVDEDNLSATLIKTIPLYYANNEGSYATFGNAIEGNTIAEADRTYTACFLKDLPSNDADYKFRLKASDNTGNSVKSDDYYYVSLDTKAPTMTLDLQALPNDETQASIKFEYNSSTDKITGKVYWREAVSPDDPDWVTKNWTETNALEISTNGNGVYQYGTITGLNFGATYELKTELFDNAKNKATFFYKKNTAPELLNVEFLFDEVTRILQMTTSNHAKGCDKLVYNDGDASDCFLSIDLLENKLYALKQNVRMGDKAGVNYQLKSTQNNERIVSNGRSDFDYVNKNRGYTNLHKYGSGSSIPDITIKPQGIKGFKSYPTVTVSQNKASVKFSCITVPGDYTYHDMEIKYAKYGDDGTLGNWSNPINYTNGAGEPQVIGLDVDARYRFKFATYNGSIYCDDSQIIETEVITKEPGAGIVKPDPVRNLQVYENPTMTTVTLNWASPYSDDFDYYIVKWIKTDASNNVQPVTCRVQKSSSSISFTANGLAPDTDYTFKVYTSKNGVLSNESSITKTTTVDPSIRVSNIYVKKNSNSYTLCYTVPPELKEWDLTLYRGTNVITQTTNNQVIPCSLQAPNSLDNINLKKGQGVKSVDIDSLESGYYQIRAKKSSTDIRYSDIIYFDYQKCTTLKELKVTSAPTKVTFSWQNYYGKKLYYKYCKVGSSTYCDPVEATPDTSLEITGLAKETGYIFQFSTSSTLFNSNIIAQGFATTKNLNPLSIIGVAINDYGFDNVKITWTRPNGSIGQWFDYYNIYSNNTLVADRISAATNEPVTITGLTPNTDYTFYVATSNKYGEESTRESCTVRTSSVPVELNPVSDVVCGYELSWSGTAAKYEISYKKSADTEWTVPRKLNPTTDTTYSLQGLLQTGTQYDVKIVSMDNSGNESAPVIETFYTYADSASFKSLNGEFEIVTTDSIKAEWVNSKGNYFVSKVVYWPEGIQGFGDYESDAEIVLATIYPGDEVKPTSYLLNNLESKRNYVFEIRTYADPTLQICSKVRKVQKAR